MADARTPLPTLPSGRPERCDRCYCWEMEDTDESGVVYGTCHRVAPRPSRAHDYDPSPAFPEAGPVTTMTTAYWPETWAHDWCYEFVPRRGVPPEAGTN